MLGNVKCFFQEEQNVHRCMHACSIYAVGFLSDGVHCLAPLAGDCSPINHKTLTHSACQEFCILYAVFIILHSASIFTVIYYFIRVICISYYMQHSLCIMYSFGIVVLPQVTNMMLPHTKNCTTCQLANVYFPSTLCILSLYFYSVSCICNFYAILFCIELVLLFFH